MTVPGTLESGQKGRAPMSDEPHYSGVYAWIVVLFCLGVYTLTFVNRLAWGTMATVAGPSLGMSVASFGVFVTAFYFSYVCSNATGGFVTDTIGPRLTILLALVPFGVFTFFFSYTPSVLVGIFIQVGMGFTAGLNYAAVIKLVSSWFPLRSRGKPMAALLLGSSLGLTLTNAIVPSLLKHFGWRGVYKGIGIITIVWGTLSYLVVRDNPFRQKQSGEKPSYRLLFQNRNLLFLALAGFGGFWATVGFANWANALMVKGYHLPLVRAGVVVVLFGIGAFVGKPLIGTIADWLGGHYKALTMCCLGLFSAMLLIFGKMSTELTFMIIAPFLGITAYSYATTMTMMITEVSRAE